MSVAPVLCRECGADQLHPVQCSSTPSVFCRGCRAQYWETVPNAGKVERRRWREDCAKRKEAADRKASHGKRKIVGSIFM